MPMSDCLYIELVLNLEGAQEEGSLALGRRVEAENQTFFCSTHQ